MGNWEHSHSGIRGSIHFESPTTVALHNFYYDGSSSALYLYSMITLSTSALTGELILISSGAGSRQDFCTFSRPYINETVLRFMKLF